MDNVIAAQKTHFSLNSCLLLEEHTANFKIPYSRDHGALHKCTPFVILDVPHPDRLVKSDLFGETLFLEISRGVVIGVSLKMHHRGSSSDIIL